MFRNFRHIIQIKTQPTRNRRRSASNICIIFSAGDRISQRTFNFICNVVFICKMLVVGEEALRVIELDILDLVRYIINFYFLLSSLVDVLAFIKLLADFRFACNKNVFGCNITKQTFYSE